MIDIAKQIVFWRDSAKEDWDMEKTEVLAEMNAFHIEGRYPESLTKPPTKDETLKYMAAVEGVFQWLMNQS